MTGHARTRRLTVHRNNREQRAKKAMREEMRDAAKDLAAFPDISGYAFVAWDKNGQSRAFWQGGHVPSLVVGEYAKRTIDVTQTIQNVRSNLIGDD